MLLDYLHNYLLRIKPLFDVDQEMESVQKDFQQQWESGTFPGWQVSYRFQLLKICIIIVFEKMKIIFACFLFAIKFNDFRKNQVEL